MSLDALLWAVKDAPVADVEEHAVLTVLADQADESGCGAFLSTKTIGKRTKLHERTVQRRLDTMLERGLLGLGDQSLARYIRADRRPVVYDLLIPYNAFANVGRVNEARAMHGLPPLTPESRPDIAEPPAPRRRADAGKKRPKKNREDGSTSSHPVEERPGTTSHPVDGVTASPTGLVVTDGATASPSRTDCKSPDPVLDPVLDPEGGTPPPSPQNGATDTAENREEEESLPTEEEMTAASSALDRVQRRANAPTPVIGRRRDVLVVLAAEALHRGWSAAQLVDALSDSLHDVKSVYAVLRHRLDYLGDPPVQKAPQPKVSAVWDPTNPGGPRPDLGDRAPGRPVDDGRDAHMLAAPSAGRAAEIAAARARIAAGSAKFRDTGRRPDAAEALAEAAAAVSR
ncbi:hypothetical protein ABZ793_33035 [Micromonospora sp. NPDC047465]|uniref:hypothetical protein n=1 Tax=Micromonospora sp. NPDC047465 TaxID=3154813 RepID=UPI0033F81ED0